MLQNLAREPEANLKLRRRSREVYGSDGISRYLIIDEVDTFARFIDGINTDPVIGEKVDESEVAKSLWILLLTFEGRPDALDAELDAAIGEQLNALRSLPRRWVAQAPIKNLVFVGFPELTVGKVSFRKTSDIRKRTVREFERRLNFTPTSYEEKLKREKKFGGKLDGVYGSAIVCAELNLEAESLRLPKLLDSEIDASLNLLRCYTHLLFSRSYKIRIGLEGELIYAGRETLSFPKDGSELSMITHSRSIGSLQPYRLTAQAVKELREKFSFDILSSVISKPGSERSGIERAVVTSIRWLGRGVSATDLPEKVLNFAAASERLLIGNSENKSEIAERYSRRLAFLTGKTPERRLEVSIRAKELYKVRNEVIHAGKTDISKKDVEEMEELTRDALIEMAQHLNEWSNHKQFAKWVEAQIFKVI
jgi:hypothetical protein